jgi:hypothetical protein
VGRIKKALLANPASASASHVGSLALCRPQAFFWVFVESSGRIYRLKG